MARVVAPSLWVAEVSAEAVVALAVASVAVSAVAEAQEEGFRAVSHPSFLSGIKKDTREAN